jgi:hypothetical protein
MGNYLVKIKPDFHNLMQKSTLILLIVCVVAGCNKEAEKGLIEPCLEAKIEEFKASPTAISLKTLKVGKETHYWFNTNARHLDGSEYIINEASDTVCFFCGECDPPDCSKTYWDADWETFWEK